MVREEVPELVEYLERIYLPVLELTGGCFAHEIESYDFYDSDHILCVFLDYSYCRDICFCVIRDHVLQSIDHIDHKHDLINIYLGGTVYGSMQEYVQQHMFRQPLDYLK